MFYNRIMIQWFNKRLQILQPSAKSMSFSREKQKSKVAFNQKTLNLHK